MEGKWISLIGYALILLIIGSIIYYPAVTVVSQENGGDNEGNAGENVENEDNETVVVNETITLDKLVELAYTVRNVTMPIVNWSLGYNVTLGLHMIKLGDRFLANALNETNSSRAKAFALVAAIHYSHALAAAYPLLGRVIRENLGENNTVTVETVDAVINVTRELSNVLEEAISIANSYNIATPDRVNILKIDAEGLLNTSIVLKNNGYIYAAFRKAVQAYHTYMRAYGVLVKAIFMVKLNLPRRFDEPLTPKLVMKKVRKEVMERYAERLPKWLRDSIIPKIRDGEIKSWEDLMKECRYEVQKRVEEFRRKYDEKSVETAVNVLLLLIMYAEYRLPIFNETHQAVDTWLDNHGITSGGMMGKVIRIEKLKDYLSGFVIDVKNRTGTTGLELVYRCIQEFQAVLRNETGKNADLVGLLQSLITMIKPVEHQYRGPGP